MVYGRYMFGNHRYLDPSRETPEKSTVLGGKSPGQAPSNLIVLPVKSDNFVGEGTNEVDDLSPFFIDSLNHSTSLFSLVIHPHFSCLNPTCWFWKIIIFDSFHPHIFHAKKSTKISCFHRLPSAFPSPPSSGPSVSFPSPHPARWCRFSTGWPWPGRWKSIGSGGNMIGRNLPEFLGNLHIHIHVYIYIWFCMYYCIWDINFYQYRFVNAFAL